MVRKHQAIDLLDFYIKHNYNDWNNWLATCLIKRDTYSLLSLKYSLQAGMTDLEKKKMNTDKINVTFSRWIGSIDSHFKQIYKKIHPVRNDNPLTATTEGVEEKRARDRQIEEILRKENF